MCLSFLGWQVEFIRFSSLFPYHELKTTSSSWFMAGLLEEGKVKVFFGNLICYPPKGNDVKRVYETTFESRGCSSCFISFCSHREWKSIKLSFNSFREQLELSFLLKFQNHVNRRHKDRMTET